MNNSSFVEKKTYIFIYLEYVGEVTQVKDVVEFDGGGQEGGTHTLMKCQSQLHKLGTAFLKHTAESFATQVLAQYAAVDGVERVCSREREREHREVALRKNKSSISVKQMQTNFLNCHKLRCKQLH